MKCVGLAVLTGSVLGAFSAAAQVGAPVHDGQDAIVVHPSARYWRRPVAAPTEILLDPLGSVRFQTPFSTVATPAGPVLIRIPHYQRPDGSYDSLGDLTNAINGVPCGVDCTERALVHWGYRP